MKQILFIFFLLVSLYGEAQNGTNKIYYKAPKIDLLYKKDGDLEIHPWGVNVLITYDKYFKSFSISFTDERNKKNIFKFYYVSILSENDDEPFIKMRTENNEFVYIADRLQLNGSLQITQDDMQSIFVIENAKKISKK